jgi:hypothetical protein
LPTPDPPIRISFTSKSCYFIMEINNISQQTPPHPNHPLPANTTRNTIPLRHNATPPYLFLILADEVAYA